MEDENEPITKACLLLFQGYNLTQTVNKECTTKKHDVTMTRHEMKMK